MNTLCSKNRSFLYRKALPMLVPFLSVFTGPPQPGLLPPTAIRASFRADRETKQQMLAAAGDETNYKRDKQYRRWSI
ncbi:MAG TPA: hypothetical protein PLZ74_07990 [Kiritimatiellia bacterium]|nr:hypothetical protein [Kiritimatiellia bacterium]